MADVVAETIGLTKQYGKQLALESVDIRIERGSIVGLIGPNGAGKTTLMKIMGGLVFPTEGELKLLGESSEKGLNAARSRMSFMIEIPYAKQAMTAKENLEKQRLQKGIADKGRIDEVLELVKLSDTGKKPVRNFSLGMRQRLGLANALLGRPEFMVLDEPVNGLDPEGIVEIRDLLLRLNREDDITILISSHILSELSLLCSEYVFLAGGRVVDRLSDKELRAECSDYMRINTTDNEKALNILRTDCGIASAERTEDGSLRIKEGMERMADISTALFKAGAIPLELARHEVNLEEYYMHKVREHA